MVVLVWIRSLLHAWWESDKVIFVVVLGDLWPSCLWTPLTIAVEIRVSLLLICSWWESYSVFFLSFDLRLPWRTFLLLVVVAVILLLVLRSITPCEKTTHTLRLQLIFVDLGDSWLFLESHITAIVVSLSTRILCLLIRTILAALKLGNVLICPIKVFLCLSQLSFKHITPWFDRLNIAVSLLLFCFRFAHLLSKLFNSLRIALLRVFWLLYFSLHIFFLSVSLGKFAFCSLEINFHVIKLISEVFAFLICIFQFKFCLVQLFFEVGIFACRSWFIISASSSSSTFLTFEPFDLVLKFGNFVL